MHAHQLETSIPVDGQPQRLAYVRQRPASRRHMDDLILGFAGHGRGDRDLEPSPRISRPVSPGCPPDVA
jgi:hypothetical protein